MLKHICTLLLIILISKHIEAQSFNKSKMDSLFDVLAKNERGMGSVALSKNGVLIYQRAIGFTEINGTRRVPATISTKYRIGSITKMFTASLIFQLVEDKKLTLSTPLATFFPQVPNANKITISQLLNHHSGIHNFTNDSVYETYMEQPKSRDEMVKIIAGATPDFAPDSTGEYSNSNYVLLGYIIEDIYKKPYAAVLKEKIIDKIGLKNTYAAPNKEAKDAPIFSYKYINNWEQETVTDMSIPGGAGNIMATPTDLVKFIEALFAGKIVSEASLEQMKTIRDHYGMGMFSFPFGNHQFYGHTGGIDGFTSSLGICPADGLSVAYCTNGARYPMNDIMIGVLSIYYKQPYHLPDFKTIPVAPEELDQYTGVYANPEVPLKITISKEGQGLKAQATGQPSFPLEAAARHRFKFDAGGIVMEFNLEEHELKLIQGGGSYVFRKE